MGGEHSAPLAFWVLLNGIDDFVIDIAAIVGYIIHPPAPTEAELDDAPQRLMAIFVASWKEHRVIRKMVENNATKLRYPRFAFFLGVYPNDAPTLAAARDAVSASLTFTSRSARTTGPRRRPIA